MTFLRIEEVTSFVSKNGKVPTFLLIKVEVRVRKRLIKTIDVFYVKDDLIDDAISNAADLVESRLESLNDGDSLITVKKGDTVNIDIMQRIVRGEEIE
jgi:hypothetical protein